MKTAYIATLLSSRNLQCLIRYIIHYHSLCYTVLRCLDFGNKLSLSFLTKEKSEKRQTSLKAKRKK